MQPMWKIIKGIMERRLQKLELHESPHGRLERKDTDTEILEMKLAQRLLRARVPPTSKMTT